MPTDPESSHPRASVPARTRRAFLTVAALVALLHAVVLGGAAATGASVPPLAPVPTLVVRTLEARPASAVPDGAPSAAAAQDAGLAATVDQAGSKGAGGAAMPPLARVAAVRASPVSRVPVTSSREASTDLSTTPVAPGGAEAPNEPFAAEPFAESPVAALARDVDAAQAGDAGFMTVALPAASGPPSLLAAGDRPPPVYRTQLPNPVTLRYELRRGFLRGTAEIRWRPEGDRYSLKFDARVAGLSVLGQTSQGQLDTTGVAPVRFLDQRMGKAQRAANFRRDTGTITFSGPSTQWPLLPGTQDRLSWMIQLVGIVAADPGFAREGRPIAMVLVSARGDAAVRSVRFVGRENVETAGGRVPALRFVVDPRGPYDGSFEIWLDPAHEYLPVHATSGGPNGEAEFELLLQRFEP